jgi:hypothetical protein
MNELILKKIEYLEAQISYLENKSRIDTITILELIECLNKIHNNPIGKSYTDIFKCRYCECIIFNKTENICELCETCDVLI